MAPDNKAKPKAAAPAAPLPPPAGVLQPGTIKRTEDDEPPWWRMPAIYGGTVIGSLLILGIVSLLGRGTPPKPPLSHPPPQEVAAMDLDGVDGSALAKPVVIPGAGVVPGQHLQKVASRAVARGRRFGGAAAAGAPIEPPPKPKADATIHYQPRGPGL
ncbi:MAG TPA: hypothetical protein VGQ83_00095 [Polyangia bacterium]